MSTNKTLPSPVSDKEAARTGRQGADAGALVAAGHRHEFGFVGHVADLEVGHDPVPQAVEPGSERIVLRPDGQCAAAGAGGHGRLCRGAVAAGRGQGLVTVTGRFERVRPAPSALEIGNADQQRQTQVTFDVHRSADGHAEEFFQGEGEGQSESEATAQTECHRLGEFEEIAGCRRGRLNDTDVGDFARTEGLFDARLFQRGGVIPEVGLIQFAAPFQLDQARFHGGDPVGVLGDAGDLVRVNGEFGFQGKDPGHGLGQVIGVGRGGGRNDGRGQQVGMFLLERAFPRVCVGDLLADAPDERVFGAEPQQQLALAPAIGIQLRHGGPVLLGDLRRDGGGVGDGGEGVGPHRAEQVVERGPLFGQLGLGGEEFGSQPGQLGQGGRPWHRQGR